MATYDMELAREYTAHQSESAFAALIGLILLGAWPAAAAPVIQFVYPPVINERAGDHVAFQVSASGTGTLSYQWYQSNSLLAGQTSASLVLTNIQTADSGQYEISVVDRSGIYVTNSVTLNVSTTPIPLHPNNLVVLRVGDGVQTLSGATGNTIYLDQYTTNGAYVSTTQIPDESVGESYGAGSPASVYGSPALLLPGTGYDYINAGMLTLSPNQQFLTFGAYCENYPFSGADVTTAANGGPYWRGLAVVNASGEYTLAYTNGGLYTGANSKGNSGANHSIRSCVTLDGTNFWTAGQAGTAGGIKCMDTQDTAYRDGSGIPAISTSSLTGTHAVQIFGTNLVYSDVFGTSGSGLYLCSGTPEPASFGSATATLLLNEGGHPNDFAISPDGQTIYIADSGVFTQSTLKGGGIQRWDTNSSGGGYVFSYTLPVDQTNGALGLAVSFPAGITQWGSNVLGAALFTTDTASILSSMVDNGPSSTAMALVNAGPFNKVLHGVRFGPRSATVPPSISSLVFSGTQLSITVTNGVAGGTFYVLSTTNLTLPLANWSVIVTNSFSASGTATNVLSINPQENQRFYCIKQ
jgi:hypothetical protein